MHKMPHLFYFLMLNILVLSYGTSCEATTTDDLSTQSESLSEEDSIKIIPVDAKNYNRYVLLKNTSEAYIKKMTAEYCELAGSEQNAYTANFKLLKMGDWFIVKLPEEIDFYIYHNLVGWYYGYEEDPDIPEYSIGFAESNKNLNDSYFFYLDPENEYGDTHIGTFNNGTNFTIFLPEAYEEKGNITVNKQLDIDYPWVMELLEADGFVFPARDAMNFSEFEVKVFQ